MRRGEAEESFMVPRVVGPQCGSRGYKRIGHTHTGAQNHRCKRCGRAFVLSRDNVVITAKQRTLIERLLLDVSRYYLSRKAAGKQGFQPVLSAIAHR